MRVEEGSISKREAAVIDGSEVATVYRSEVITLGSKAALLLQCH